MHILKLKISDKVFDKFTWLLNKFSKDEIEIIEEDAEFSENQRYLEKEYSDLLKGRAKFVDIDEAELRLENAIKKYEDSL